MTKYNYLMNIIENDAYCLIDSSISTDLRQERYHEMLKLLKHYETYSILGCYKGVKSSTVCFVIKPISIDVCEFFTTMKKIANDFMQESIILSFKNIIQLHFLKIKKIYVALYFSTLKGDNYSIINLSPENEIVIGQYLFEYEFQF